MTRKALPRIMKVAAGAEPLTLQIQWSTGEETPINAAMAINSFSFYAPLRENRDLFRQVRVGEQGADIVWPGELDMSNDTLWRLAQEQSGATMTAAAFRHWRQRPAYTLRAPAPTLW